MQTIHHLLEEIEKRPGLYLGRNSIFSLIAFLGGVHWAKPDMEGFDMLGRFQEWIVAKYRIETSHDWAQIINFYSVDECNALKKFFILFKEFKEEHG